MSATAVFSGLIRIDCNINKKVGVTVPRVSATTSRSGDPLRVLVVGNDARHIVCSAKRAGFYVASITRYEYSDLIKCGDATLVGELHGNKLSVRAIYVRDGSPEAIINAGYKAMKSLVRVLAYDHAILATPFEALNIPRRAGNSPSLVKFVNDKVRLKDKLQSLGYPVPQQFDLEDNMSFPVILKPRRGLGGIWNVLAADKQHLERSIEQYHENGVDDFFLEEYVRGKDASASVLSTGKQALTIAINEQLLGLKNLGQMQQFRFCGSLTPLRTSYTHEIEEISNSVATDLGLVGTNGIDFMIGPNGPVIIEINPRFQETLDTIEGAFGINLVEAHIRSCQGDLIPRPRYSRFACRMTYYAERDFCVTKTCGHANYMDVPQKGTIIKRGEPVISAIGYGTSKDCAFNNASHHIETAKKECVA